VRDGRNESMKTKNDDDNEEEDEQQESLLSETAGGEESQVNTDKDWHSMTDPLLPRSEDWLDLF